LGVDLAKSLDFTSLGIIEMSGDLFDPRYHLKALDRVRGVDYPTLCETILATMDYLLAEKEPGNDNGEPCLCMDASGLGSPVRDFLLEADLFATGRAELYGVVFTGGESARRDPLTGNYNISKSLIVSNLLSLMQRKRFTYAGDLEALPLLELEISAFKSHATPSGKTTFDAEAGEHDDLIFAIAIPLLIAEWIFKQEAVREPVAVPIPKTPTEDPFNRRTHPQNFDYRWYN
jgi:hypothetical protein